jgi:YVTN family beta-propeller protein
MRSGSVRRLGFAAATFAIATAGILLIAGPASAAGPVTIPVGSGPSGVAFAPDGKTAYVTAQNANTVTAIDVATSTIKGTPIQLGTGLGKGPYGIVVSPDGTRAYVADFYGGGVSVIDTATNTLITTIAVSGANGPYSVAISKDGSTVFATSSIAGTVVLIDTATNTVSTTTPSIAVMPNPFALAVSPDGSKLYVTGGTNMVAVIDVATRTLDPGFITVGNSPFAVAFTPDGTHAYIVNGASGTVSAINVATKAVDATITVGTNPTGIAISPDGIAYVTDYNGANIRTIDTATNTVVGATIAATGHTVSDAISPDGTLLYYLDQDVGSTVTIREINAGPHITSAAPPAAVMGTPYFFTVTATGRPVATFAVSAGALPTGLMLDPATGVISGTPNASGTAPFSISASNGIGTTSTAAYSVTVLALPVAAAVDPSLAATGTDAAPATILDGGLLVVGLALVFIRRRPSVR